MTLSVDDVHEAAQRLRGVARRTPLLSDVAFDARAGCRTVGKAEMFQIGGAFKFRGAYNRLRCLSRSQRKARVVAASSGNHAQALAIAARLCDTTAIAFTPHDAPPGKAGSSATSRCLNADLRPLYRRPRSARREHGRRDWTYGSEWLRRSAASSLGQALLRSS